MTQVDVAATCLLTSPLHHVCAVGNFWSVSNDITRPITRLLGGHCTNRPSIKAELLFGCTLKFWDFDWLLLHHLVQIWSFLETKSNVEAEKMPKLKWLKFSKAVSVLDVQSVVAC